MVFFPFFLNLMTLPSRKKGPLLKPWVYVDQLGGLKPINWAALYKTGFSQRNDFPQPKASALGTKRHFEVKNTLPE